MFQSSEGTITSSDRGSRYPAWAMCLMLVCGLLIGVTAAVIVRTDPDHVPSSSIPVVAIASQASVTHDVTLMEPRLNSADATIAKPVTIEQLLKTATGKSLPGKTHVSGSPSGTLEERAIGTVMDRLNNGQPINILLGTHYFFKANSPEDLANHQADGNAHGFDVMYNPFVYAEDYGPPKSPQIALVYSMTIPEADFNAYATVYRAQLDHPFRTQFGTALVTLKEHTALDSYYHLWVARMVNVNCNHGPLPDCPFRLAQPYLNGAPFAETVMVTAPVQVAASSDSAPRYAVNLTLGPNGEQRLYVGSGTRQSDSEPEAARTFAEADPEPFIFDSTQLSQVPAYVR